MHPRNLGRNGKLSMPRRWLAGILSRAAAQIAPGPLGPRPLQLTTDELFKLPGIGRIDFEALRNGEVKVQYRALDPIWKGHSEETHGMVPLRDHMMRLCGVAEEFSNRGYSDDLRAVAESLHLAASIRDLSADTDVHGDSLWCGDGADFDQAHSELAEKYLGGVIIFNLVWSAYEWAVDIAGRPLASKHAKGARGRDLIFRLLGDKHFPYLRKAVLDALDLCPRKCVDFKTPEMRRLLTAGSFAGIGAEYLREFRNTLVHGALGQPMPDDWGKDCKYVADDDPAVRRFHTNIRLTLLLIQVLLRSITKDDEELRAWLADPQPATLVLTQLHCPCLVNEPEELPLAGAPLVIWDDHYAMTVKYRH
jgi:hypothetical protein